jgi:hypothetical protein
LAVLAAGPGVTNGVTGAHVAYDNCFPLVILGGSGPQRARYTGTFQETENISMFKGITKMAVQVDSTARLPESLAMAFRKVRTGRPGPVYLDLPSDVLQSAVEEERVRWSERYYTQARPLGDPAQVKRAAELLCTAERPMMIVGKGIRWSEPTLELRRLVETLGMPFMTSPVGRGFIPDDHPLNLGTARSALMGNADVILVVGAWLNWMFGFGRQWSCTYWLRIIPPAYPRTMEYMGVHCCLQRRDNRCRPCQAFTTRRHAAHQGAQPPHAVERICRRQQEDVWREHHAAGVHASKAVEHARYPLRRRHGQKPLCLGVAGAVATGCTVGGGVRWRGTASPCWGSCACGGSA